ncbi:peptidylprolyl isomerase [candidate division WOR_3 bacterium SM23_42]|uniref:Peptidyl-prolyl cis-trans isomerase n=1 Tax=candidate division WOR_3 bacterium SM23_42 TaxID=1703779 RepID=A0A0S8FV16_UNCW3|nr:MAG: peptidylprolyl isomerase [candidate division WOR_3 bacterium SM23_42]
MKRLSLLLAFAVFNMSCQSRSRSRPIVLVETELGDVIIELFLDRAPITASNFLRYVDENRFGDASFYRVVRLNNQPDIDVKIEVIQGGIGFVESDLRLPPIIHETTRKTGVLHKNGVISMARREPGTASSEFFICVGDQPELDFGGKRNPDGQGYATFGRVIQGMDVVHAIQQRPAQGQMLVSPVKIINVRRMKARSLRPDSSNHGANK